MGKNSFREENTGIQELLDNFTNLRNGEPSHYIEEDDFARIINYYIEKDQNTDALEAANIASKQFSYSASLLILKADILLSLKKYKESLWVIEKASLLDSSDPTIFIVKTEVLLALDRQEEAAEILEQAVEVFDGEDKINLLFELADVYDDYEDFDKVFNCLQLILDQDPANEEALYKICFWTDYTGRNQEGIELHKEILEKNPFSELAWFNLGAAFQGIKLYEKAIDAYQYAVAIHEKFDYAYRNMGDAFIRLKKYKDAIECLEKVLALAAPESIIYEAIGHCYDKMDNFAQARFHYKKASHLNPEDPQMHYKIATTYMNEANWKNAIKSLQGAMKNHILQPDFNLALGRCYVELGKFEEAITHLANVVRVRPKNVNGWVELLNCLYKGGLFDEGFEYAVLAFEQTDSKPIFVYYKSAFLFASGQSKQALSYLEYALMANRKMVKKFIDINPSVLQNSAVVDLIATYKKSKKKN